MKEEGKVKVEEVEKGRGRDGSAKERSKFGSEGRESERQRRKEQRIRKREEAKE